MRSKAIHFISSALLLTTICVTQTFSSVAHAAGPANTKVALGESHAVAVSTSGSVWTWGSLVPGPRGAGSRYSITRPTEVTIPGSRDIVNVATTRQSSVALASDGTVWAWGYLGLGLGDSAATTSTDYLNPVQIAFGSTRISKVAGDCEGYVAIDTNGDVWQWGSFWGVWSLSGNAPTKVNGVSNAVAVAKSCSSAYAVLSDGTIKAWGSNGGGKLGDGTTSDRQTPVSVAISGRSVSNIAVSDTHVLALASDGSVWGWGSNYQSQLALDPASFQYSSTPRRISITGATGSVVSIAATGNAPSSFAVMSSGEVWEWGTWSPTQYAPRQRPLPVSELGSAKLVSVAVYYNNLLFVGSDNSIWGRGQFGQYGSLIDGNCGSDAIDYPQWINGRSIQPKYLVRAHSSSQFGPTFSEDKLYLRGLSSLTGTLLPLDGSGTAVGRQYNLLSIVATAPTSSCFASNQLAISWDFNGDGIYETTGVSSNNEGETPINTGSYTPDWSGRRRASVKITNPDGASVTYLFWLGVAAAANIGGGGGVIPALPVVETSDGTSIALGTDKHVYGWGEQTAVLGIASTVPRRLLPNVSTEFSKLKFIRSYRSIGFSVAGVMTAAGVVSIWGSSPGSGIFFNEGGTRVNSSSALYTIEMPFGVTRWLDFTIEQCNRFGTPQVFVKLIGDDQQLYVHGVGNYLCTGSNSRIPLTPSVTTGLQFSQFGPDQLIKGIDAWKYWTVQNVGTPISDCYSSVSCASSPVEYYSVLSANPMAREIYKNASYCTWGRNWTALEITSSGQVESVVRTNADTGTCGRTYPRSGRGVFSVVSRTNISNWSNRTAIAIGGNPGRWRNDETRIIASDGTVWAWDQWSRSPLRPLILDPRMPVVKRFAGNSGYVVAGDSSLWALPPDDYEGAKGATLGSCATTWSNDEGAAVHVFSTGQFGPTYSEDRFGFQVDAESLIANEQFPNQGYLARGNDWGGSPSVYLRPNSSGRLFGYVTSSCAGADITTVQWDMDDNGTYESAGVITQVAHDATPMATPRTDRFGVETYPGFSSVWKQVMTPAMDLTAPGGRYIGVKMMSAFGYQTKRFTVLVQPKKPIGYVGMTINSGARFTDSTDVELTLNWPEGAITALISNDGAFNDAQEVLLARTVKWKLLSTGVGQLGTTVYVRFYNLYPDGSGSWNKDEVSYQIADDIVLDLSAPEVSNVSAATSQAMAAAFRMDGIVMSKKVTQYAIVNVAAFDLASGIAGMQVASDPAVPGSIRPYSSQVRVPVDRERIAVRVLDNVGLWSDWQYARVTGFVAIPEVPAIEPGSPDVSPPGEKPATTPVEKPSTPDAVPSVDKPEVKAPAAVESPVPAVAVPEVSPAQPTTVFLTNPFVAAIAKVPTSTATAVLKGTTASISVSVPSSLAKKCTTKVVKGKKVSACIAAAIVVSVSGGATKTYSAKSGSNAFKMPAKKGATVTIMVGGKVIKKIKL